MKWTRRENITNLPYSLHDSHVRKIKLEMLDENTANVKLLFSTNFCERKDDDALPVPELMGITGIYHSDVPCRRYGVSDTK